MDLEHARQIRTANLMVFPIGPRPVKLHVWAALVEFAFALDSQQAFCGTKVEPLLCRYSATRPCTPLVCVKILRQRHYAKH
jgi:hypothetical protein